MREHLLAAKVEAATANPEGLETLEMSIDEAGVGVLMSNLTNLYADSELAVLREYTSNALDSHRRAGQKAPIEITIPDAYGRVADEVIIEDFGVGMSKDEIRDIYSRYGASTKRETNDQIGAFGLGAKSALAVANRFDIVASKGGITTRAYVKKNSSGVGQFFFTSEEETGAPDGVKVTIPILRRAAYDPSKLKWFFLGLAKKEIDVKLPHFDHISVHDSEQFEPLRLSGATVAWVSKLPRADKGNAYFHVTVGGVHYSLYSNRILEQLRGEAHVALQKLIKYQQMLVLNVPLGSVKMTPSREDLNYTPLTVETLSNLIVHTFELLNRRAQRELNAITSRKEALAFVIEQRDLKLPNAEELKWQGEVVPLRFDASGWANIGNFSTKANLRYFEAGETISLEQLGRDEVSEYAANGKALRHAPVTFPKRQAILVTDATKADVAFAQKQLGKVYSELRFPERKVDANVWFISPGIEVDAWTRSLITETFTFEQFKEQVRAEQKRRREEKAAAGLPKVVDDKVLFALIRDGQFTMRSSVEVYESKLVTVDEINAMRKQVILSHKSLPYPFDLGAFSNGKGYNRYVYDKQNLLKFASHYHPDAVIIGVPRSVQISSLQKRFPNHLLLSDVLHAEVERVVSESSTRAHVLQGAAARIRRETAFRTSVIVKYAAKLNTRQWRAIRSEATRQWLTQLLTEESKVEAAAPMDEQLIAQLGALQDEVAINQLIFQWRSRADRYALLPSVASRVSLDRESAEHFVLYVNAVDKAGEQ